MAKMEPAEIERLKQALSSQDVLIGQHEATLTKVLESLQQLSSSVNRLSSGFDSLLSQHVTSDTTSAPVSSVSGSTYSASLVTHSFSPREPFIPTPARHSGDLGCCSQFLFQSSLVFSEQPLTYSSDVVKIAFASSILSGRAAAWALATSSSNSIFQSDFNAFSCEMWKVFDHPVKGREAFSRLLSLRQGGQSVSEFTVTFRILVAEADWDQTTLLGVFRRGLSEEVKDELAAREEAQSLDKLIDLAICLDNQL